jgi:NTP pyrophosphatase (non-canonical NTP hydrolase)
VGISEELKKVADYYGYEEQSNQLIEECAELIQALNKYRRAGGKGQKTDIGVLDALANVIEELADVEVMLDQIKYLLNISESSILAVKQAKTIRQRNRMQGE